MNLLIYFGTRCISLPAKTLNLWTQHICFLKDVCVSQGQNSCRQLDRTIEDLYAMHK